MMENQEIKGSFILGLLLFHKWMGIFQSLLGYF